MAEVEASIFIYIRLSVERKALLDALEDLVVVYYQTSPSLNSCYSVWWPSYAFSNAAIYLDAVKHGHP